MSFFSALAFSQAGAPLPDAPKAAAQSAKSPDYSQEPFVFEQYSTRVRFENDGTGRKEVQARVRVQSEGGVQALGQLVFGYNSANEKVEIGYVRVRRADGSVVNAPADAVQDLTAPVAREAPVYTDYHQKHITVPALRPGETLEYDIITTITTPLAPGEFWVDYDFEKDSIVLDEQFELNVPGQREIKLKLATEAPQPVISEQGDRKIYLWKSSHTAHEDRKKKKRPSEPPPPAVQVTTFRNWEEVGRWYAGLERDRVRPSPEIIAKAEELTRGSKSDMDKLEALYDYVAKNFRYVSLSLGLGRYQPHAASEILANQYGDCKDKHTLLAAMLAAVGLHANAALINSSRKIDPDVPSPSQFDHVISEVPLGRQSIWVDTTAEVAPFRLLMSQLRGKQALLVTADGKGRLVETPPDPIMPNSQVLEMEGKVSDLGKLDLHLHYVLRGDIETALRMALRRIPRPNWKDFAQNIARLAGFSGDVSDVHASDPEATREPLQFEFTVSEPNYIDWSSKKVKFRIPPVDFIALPETDDSADSSDTGPPEPVKLEGPLEATDHFTFELPAKYTTRVPIPVNVTRDYATYQSTYQVEGHTFSGVRKLQISAHELPAARSSDYAAFRRAVSSDQQQTLGLESASAGAPTIPTGATADELNEAGGAALGSGNYESAAMLFRRVVELQPKHKSAWNNLGRAYLLQRRFDDAVVAFRKQLDVNPYDDIAWNLIAQTYTEEQKWDDAIAAYKKQLENSPLDPFAHYGLGSAYLEIKKYQEAVPELEQASSLQPDNAMAQVNLGRAYLGLQQNDKALAAFDKGVDIQANPLIWNNEAYELAKAKVALDRAQQYAESAVTSTAAQLRNVNLDRLTMNDVLQVQSLAAYWDTLGWVHFQRGDMDTAEKYIRAAWLLSQHGEVGDHLAQIYEKGGQKDQAIHTYALSLAATHTDPDTRGRLAALVGEKKVDSQVNSVRQELSEMRSVKLGKLFKDKTQASAEFFLVMSPGANTEVKFIKGDEQLRPLAGALRTAAYPVTFPDNTPTNVVRRAVVTCSSANGECTLVLLTPENVTSVE